MCGSDVSGCDGDKYLRGARVCFDLKVSLVVGSEDRILL